MLSTQMVDTQRVRIMVTAVKISVLGAGLMGHGIALTLASAGHRVRVFDPSTQALASLHQRIRESMDLLGRDASHIDTTLDLVTTSGTLADCVCESDFVFESAPEKVELKTSLFSETIEHAPENATIASNTSVIQISKIVRNLTTRHRLLGTHWWNPPHQIPLVEVVKTEWTNASVATAMQELLNHAGKHAVMVEKDVPGFIGNRLQHALWREAISLVENGICSAEAVDDVVKSSFGRRLAVLGPLENADLVGIELTQDIHKQVLYDLENTVAPADYLQTLLNEKKTGMSEGQGFRQWERGDVEKTKARIANHLSELEKILQD